MLSIIGSLASFVPTVIGLFGELPKAINFLVALDGIIKDAEATGEDGPTKLAKVLNDAEAAINTLSPAISVEFGTIAPEIEAVVNAIVAFYNEFAQAKPVVVAAPVTPAPAA